MEPCNIEQGQLCYTVHNIIISCNKEDSTNNVHGIGCVVKSGGKKMREGGEQLNTACMQIVRDFEETCLHPCQVYYRGIIG